LPGLMENLMDVLTEQAVNYENLLGLSVEKKDVIVANDTKALQTITSLENTLLGMHQRLDRKRIDILKDIAIVLGRKEEDLTFTGLLELLQGKPDLPRMEEIVERIRKAIPELKLTNDLNKQLIDNSLAYIEFTMNAIRGSLAGEPSPYPNKDDHQDSAPLFDAKQ